MVLPSVTTPRAAVQRFEAHLRGSVTRETDSFVILPLHHATFHPTPRPVGSQDGFAPAARCAVVPGRLASSKLCKLCCSAVVHARANGAQASWIQSIAPDSAAAGSGLGQPRAERPKRGKGEDSLREGSASSGVPRPLRQCLSSFAAAAFRGGRATKEFETMLWEHEVVPTQGSPPGTPHPQFK